MWTPESRNPALGGAVLGLAWGFYESDCSRRVACRFACWLRINGSELAARVWRRERTTEELPGDRPGQCRWIQIWCVHGGRGDGVSGAELRNLWRELGSAMTAWGWGLLLKPLIAVGIVAVYYFVIYRGSHTIGRFIKNDRLYDFLFRERGRNDPGYGTRPSDKRRSSTKNLRHLTRRDR